MMQSEPLYAALLGFWNEFREFPPTAHLFCPKVDDEDQTTYDEPDLAEQDVSVEEKKKRIADAGQRQVTTYRLSLMLCIREEDAGTWLSDWKEAVSGFLTSCDKCARNYHRLREEFLKALELYGVPPPRTCHYGLH